jgi:ferredoxin-NADP reductase
MRTSNQGLVDELSHVLQRLREKQVKVGGRLDVSSLLEREAVDDWKRIGVVVCGPGGLCDDVRSLVAKRARTGDVVWELYVEAFSW